MRVKILVFLTSFGELSFMNLKLNPFSILKVLPIFCTESGGKKEYSNVFSVKSRDRDWYHFQSARTIVGSITL